MTRKTMLIASVLVAAAMAGAAAFAGSHLPPAVPLPMHWGLDGQSDRFADKWTALLMPLLVTVAVSLVMYALPAIEPRKLGMERSQGLYLSAWAAVLLIGPVQQLAVLSVAFHWPVHGTAFVLGGVGLILLLIGNQLGKSRSTYMMGIRTPWTLASEEVWIKTHRLGGKLMAGGGIVLLVAAFLPLPSGLIATLLVGVIFTVSVVSVLYSYLLWRREQAGHPSA